MIHDPLLRWVVTGLFALGAIDCAAPIFTRRVRWTVAVSQCLHFAMAVAMVTMAWPWSAHLPWTGPAVFFLLATLWFAAVGAKRGELSTLYGYHSLMMLATAWMYLHMSGALTAEHAGLHRGASMPGPTGGGTPVWVDSVNWIGVTMFAAGTVFWAFRYARCRSLASLAQLSIAAGTAIMFVSMLFEI